MISYKLIVLILFSFFAITSKATIECSLLAKMPEIELTETLINFGFPYQCVKNDQTISEVLKTLDQVLPLLMKHPLLEHREKKRIKNIILAKPNFFPVDFKLCINITHQCYDESQLIAKNYKKNKFILINRQQWNALSSEFKVRILAHELLGMTGLEVNSYQYSSTLPMD